MSPVCPTCRVDLSPSATAAGLCPACLLEMALSAGGETDDASALLAPGAAVGPFHIVRLLGRGGMATVYEAHDATLDRAIALKLLPPHLLQNAAFARRFEREARVVARLDHPNIVPIYSTGIDNGTPWMSMRLLPGGNLAAVVDRRPPSADAIRMLRDVALALDYAHAQGVVHRDIKPTNLLLDGTGRVSVSDFGLAQIVGSDAGQTKSGVLAGTPHYMAPEQALGAAVDYRCDIYSFAIVAYELFAGEPPFTAESPMAVLFKHVNEPVPDLPDQVLPAAAMRVIRTATAKEPAVRFASATAFVDALDAALTTAARTGRSRTWKRNAAIATAIGAAVAAWMVVRPPSSVAPTSQRATAPVLQTDIEIPATKAGAAVAEPPAALAAPPDASRPAAIASDPPQPGVGRAPAHIASRPNSPAEVVPLAAARPSASLAPITGASADEPAIGPGPPQPPAADVVIAPVRVRTVTATYPTVARAAQLEGDVLVQAVVDVDGKVRDVAIVKSVHRLLDDAAKAAVMKYEYVPGQRNGIAEPAIVRIVVSFRMR
jgi:TonB family protein